MSSDAHGGFRKPDEDDAEPITTARGTVTAAAAEVYQTSTIAALLDQDAAPTAT